MIIQGSQNSPKSGVVNAKWREGISTYLSINPSHKNVLKIVSWHMHTGTGKEAGSKADKTTPAIS